MTSTRHVYSKSHYICFKHQSSGRLHLACVCPFHAQVAYQYETGDCAFDVSAPVPLDRTKNLLWEGNYLATDTCLPQDILSPGEHSNALTDPASLYGRLPVRFKADDSLVCQPRAARPQTKHSLGDYPLSPVCWSLSSDSGYPSAGVCWCEWWAHPLLQALRVSGFFLYSGK